MKNQKIKILVFSFAVFFSGFFNLNAETRLPSSLNFSLMVPQSNMDFSDLDMRDADNRPIHQAALSNRMNELFIRNLHELLFLNLTPVRRSLLKILSQSWDVISGWLKQAGSFIVVKVSAWVQKFKVFFFRSSSVRMENKFSTSIRVARSFFHSLSLQLITTVRILR